MRKVGLTKHLLVLPAIFLVTACEEPSVHILSGQEYVPQYHCVEPVTAFDVATGGTVSNSCAPTCLTIDEADAEAVYVTNICGPFPGDYGVEAEDAATDAADPCTGAFQAYLEDGGLCPEDVWEGGLPPDAGTDATVSPSLDAGADAPQDAPPGQ